VDEADLGPRPVERELEDEVDELRAADHEREQTASASRLRR